MLSTAQLSLLCWCSGTDAVLRCATIGDAVFFYFPLALLHLGECAWFQYSRFRQNCKYFFGAAAVPPSE